jgi:hypothetical protein
VGGSWFRHGLATGHAFARGRPFAIKRIARSTLSAYSRGDLASKPCLVAAPMRVLIVAFETTTLRFAAGINIS